MKILVLLVTLFSSSLLSASTEFGNGGNAIVCADGSAFMYDAVEATHRYSMLLYFPQDTAAPKNCAVMMGNKVVCDTGTLTAKALVARLKTLDPELEAKLQVIIDSFWAEAQFTIGDLLPVNDTGLGFTLAGCTLRQLAIQHEPIFPEDSRYFINYHIWNALDDGNKAVMIVHEALYNYALQLNPSLNTSERLRYFNSLIMADRLKNMTPEKYQAIKAKVFNQ
ncbi:MAG: hypothetical protein J7501_07940 [Bdellovibrio sp.]|nr:hypothetical protein [Bdellovibrio sp.]